MLTDYPVALETADFPVFLQTMAWTEARASAGRIVGFVLDRATEQRVNLVLTGEEVRRDLWDFPVTQDETEDPGTRVLMETQANLASL